MVIAALIAFAILLIAWIIAPSEGAAPDASNAPAAEPLPVTA